MTDRADRAIFLRDMLFARPEALPIHQIDGAFDGAVPICTGLRTAAGSIDALFMYCRGRLTLVDCGVRRRAAHRLLDHAEALGGWSYAMLEAAVARQLGQPDIRLFDLLRRRHPRLSEAHFIAAAAHNLALGRMLLLIVGAGLGEAAGAIRRRAHPHATLGLIEAPTFRLPAGEILAIPRVLRQAEADAAR